MDRVSELQSLLEQLGVLMIRQFEQLSPLPSASDPQNNARGKIPQQQIDDAVAQIISTSKSIDSFLDALPDIENKEEEQLERIAQLDTENKRYEGEILELVAVAESKLSHVRSSLSQIALDQLNLADGS
jgi:DNA repair ATPase RecN